MHYFLYFPGRKAVSPDEMKGFGLGALVDGAGPGWRQIQGPDSGEGALATWTPGGATAPFVMDDLQTWEEHPGSPLVPQGTYWLGWYEKERPSPDDLKKDESFDSYGAVLGDENMWDIPVARYLPHENCWDIKTGQYSRSVAEKYKEYWGLSEQFVRQFFEQLDEFEINGVDEQRDKIQLEDIPMHVTWDYCVRALEMNYRLTSDLIQWFGLLKEDIWVLRLVIASTEMPLRVEMIRDQKKTVLPSRISASVSQFI